MRLAEVAENDTKLQQEGWLSWGADAVKGLVKGAKGMLGGSSKSRKGFKKVARPDMDDLKKKEKSRTR